MMTRRLLVLPACLLGAIFLVFPRAGDAAVVDAKLSSGKLATANYHPGAKGRPAVLILHGFLQTRAFPTVATIVDAVSTDGYTTLAPTLTLGISRRNKSLPCEAVHLHSLEEDVDEVAFWVRWLVRKGHTRIILVGHSYGNLQLLSYMRGHPSPAVKQLLMISLTDVERKQGAQQRTRLAQNLRDRLASGQNGLVDAEVGHCQKYVSPPAALLSYLSITRESILDALAKTRVPTEVIMGSKDDRMGPDWVEKLKSRGLVVRVVPDASHFFDNQYEFDLQEAVLRALHDTARER
jgi:pimeloyl-ACP methyl ester carboxylesterase